MVVAAVAVAGGDGGTGSQRSIFRIKLFLSRMCWRGQLPASAAETTTTAGHVAAAEALSATFQYMGCFSLSLEWRDLLEA